ncbi:MAG: selenocysteine-specific translation elongation factor [Micromonosporaceae bacterium]|nr:selenocysteine-specific translation elongation factor [Micromonosporaceae bacterium]
MHVIATAGHVDHGKSTLVRALTGMEPDRLAEERRRGLTIDLGFVWTRLPSGDTMAFVDVPGHARFVPTMLAGVGPAPAVMFVVAADEGWMPQSGEHLEALTAFGVTCGVLAVSRSDLADPGPVLVQARERLARSGLGDVPAVAVSGTTGMGIDALRGLLDDLSRRLPSPDPAADVRLWIDRVFSVKGAGTVVTGTLGSGTVRVDDELVATPSPRPVRVRGMQCLGVDVDHACGVSRVALNLRGVSVGDIQRGGALLTPGRWRLTTTVDVRLTGRPDHTLPRALHLHIGAADRPTRVRPLGADTARLGFDEPLPLRVADRVLLRDPGGVWGTTGAVVLDPDPPPLAPRGGGAGRARELAAVSAPDLAAELRRRKVARASHLSALGIPIHGKPVLGDWLADPDHWASLGRRLADLAGAHAARHPLDGGLTVAAARDQLGLPDARLVTALVASPLAVRDGRIVRTDLPTLPPAVQRAVEALRHELADQPYAAPDAPRLAALGLGAPELAAAVRAGLLTTLAPGVYVLPAAEQVAFDVLGRLEQPFTVAQARKALAVSRRVAVPLLEHLDRRGMTRRLPDSTRRVNPSAPQF